MAIIIYSDLTPENVNSNFVEMLQNKQS